MDTLEQIKPKGKYTFISLKKDPTKAEQKLLQNYAHKNDIESYLKVAHLIERIDEQSNLVPTVGRNVLARLLSGDTTYSGEINYGALGSGTTAFTNSSTQLNTEVYRKAPASTSFDNNIAYVDWFIASGDVADATYEEFGAFIDGTASANTGQAFSLVITGGWVKSGSIFISLQITLT